MLKRKDSAFAQGTKRNHVSQIRLYLSFCIRFGLKEIDPSTDTICIFIEFLAQHMKSPKSVTNYLSAVRFLHKWLGVTAPALESFEVTLLIRACYYTMDHVPLQRRPLTPELIRKLLSAAQSIVPNFPIFKCAVLLSFFGFLRMSNMTPRTSASFDPRKHTCRGDVFHADPGLVILLKWSKTNQYGQKTELVPIPTTQDPEFCPVVAYNQMVDLAPTLSPNQPLLSLTEPGKELIPVHPDWLA